MKLKGNNKNKYFENILIKCFKCIFEILLHITKIITIFLNKSMRFTLFFETANGSITRKHYFYLKIENILNYNKLKNPKLL